MLLYSVFKDGTCVYTPKINLDEDIKAYNNSFSSNKSNEESSVIDSDESLINHWLNDDSYSNVYTKEDKDYITSQDCSKVYINPNIHSDSSKKSIFRRFLDWLKRIFHRR